MHWFVKDNPMLDIGKMFNYIKSEINKYRHSALEYKRAKLVQEQGILALKDAVEVLEAHQICYWIDAGTLLGILRDEEFVEDDTDIDIAIIIDNAEDLYKVLEDNGYNIWYYYDDEQRNKNLIRAEKHNVGIDFEVFKKHKDKYFYDAPRSLPTSVKTNQKNKKAILRFEFDASIIEPIAKYTYKNIEFNIPSSYDQYFHTYYNNWEKKEKKNNYLDGYFSLPIEKYRHHNKRAYYLKEYYLYFHTVSPSIIRVDFIDMLLHSLNNWKK